MEIFTDRTVIETALETHALLTTQANAAQISPSGHRVSVDSTLSPYQIDTENLSPAARGLLEFASKTGFHRITIESCSLVPGDPTPNGHYWLEVRAKRDQTFRRDIGIRAEVIYPPDRQIWDRFIAVHPTQMMLRDKLKTELPYLRSFSETRAKEVEVSDTLALLSLAKIALQNLYATT